MAGPLPSRDKPESRDIRKFVATILPFLLLTIPSVWLLLFVPPLWRDVDAYNQTVLPPGLVTILHHGPLYCALSRFPLWFGYLISNPDQPSRSAISLSTHSLLTPACIH